MRIGRGREGKGREEKGVGQQTIREIVSLLASYQNQVVITIEIYRSLLGGINTFVRAG